MAAKDAAVHLDSIDLFQSLSPREISTIAGRLRSCTFKAGEPILLQGQPGDALHIIKSGLVSVVVEDRGQERELERLGTGESVGEMSLMTGEPCSATVRALSKTEVLTLPRADFVDMLEECPGLWRNLSRSLSHRLLRTNRRLLSPYASKVVALALPGSPDEASVLALSLLASVSRQTKQKALLLDWRGDSACAPRLAGAEPLPGPADLLLDRSLLKLHEAMVGGTGSLGGGRVAADAKNDHQPTEPEALTALGWLRPHYATVLLVLSLDGEPPSPEFVEHVDSLILVVSEERAGSAFRWIDRLRAVPRAERKLEAALMAHKPLPTDTLRRLEERLGKKVRHRLPRNDAAVRAALSGDVPCVLSDPLDPLTRGVDRLARRVAGLGVGLALGAGAAKGFAHLGVLRALEREGIPVDYIAGSSVGAIIGGLYAGGMPLGEIERRMHGADRKLRRWTIPYSALWSDAGLKELLSEPGPAYPFHELNIPFAAVATDLATGREVVLEDGVVWRAVRASVSIPGIFPPSLVNGRYMVDGGLVDPVPGEPVRRMGADIVVAVDLMSPPPNAGKAERGQSERRRRTPSLLEVLWRSTEIMQGEIAERSGATADLTIWPKIGNTRLSDFTYRGEAFMAAGEAATIEVLPQLRSLLPAFAHQTVAV
ncbi:MAG: patatin-like phospholipase family protein [Chloroflexi bacterium]|nr:patatin-like phospholipase family protein [Chloroflexota bacterium]